MLGFLRFFRNWRLVLKEKLLCLDLKFALNHSEGQFGIQRRPHDSLSHQVCRTVKLYNMAMGILEFLYRTGKTCGRANGCVPLPLLFLLAQT